MTFPQTSHFDDLQKQKGKLLPCGVFPLSRLFICCFFVKSLEGALLLAHERDQAQEEGKKICRNAVQHQRRRCRGSPCPLRKKEQKGEFHRPHARDVRQCVRDEQHQRSKQLRLPERKRRAACKAQRKIRDGVEHEELHQADGDAHELHRRHE